jgi:hypothetical protein
MSHVLTRPAPDVQDHQAARVDTPQQRDEARRLLGVVLELSVDEIVDLGRFAEHRFKMA